MLKRILITAVAFVSWATSVAQLTESDTLRFGYKANVNGSWITGNVERLLINNNLDLSHVGQHIGLKSSNTYTYGTIFKRETENDFFSRNFVYLNPKQKLYPYIMVWLQNSKRQQIEFRSQVGIGLTYTLLHTPQQLLKLSGTISKEETRYNGTSFFIIPENLVINEVDNWRGTIRLLGQHRLSNRKLRFSYETWYQPAFDDSANWRYYVNAALELPFSKHFSFRTAMVYSHDNIVLTSIKRDDKFVTFGLTFGNY